MNLFDFWTLKVSLILHYHSQIYDVVLWKFVRSTSFWCEKTALQVSRANKDTTPSLQHPCDSPHNHQRTCACGRNILHSTDCGVRKDLPRTSHCGRRHCTTSGGDGRAGSIRTCNETIADSGRVDCGCGCCRCQCGSHWNIESRHK